MSALQRRPGGDAGPETKTDTRALLLEHAKYVFADKGFDGATVKDLADAAGVNVSLVSYYFGGKEGLYRECLSGFGRDRLMSAERFLTHADSVEDIRVRLQLMIEEILATHAREPEIAKILHREFDSNAEHIQDLFQSTFMKIFATLVQFIKEAQARDLLHREFEPEIAVGMLFGGVIQTIRMDSIAKQLFGTTIADPDYRARVARTATTVLLQGTIARPPSVNARKEFQP